MEENKKEKKPKSKLRKVLGWVITCVFAGLFLFVAAYQIVSNNSKKNNHGVPTFAGQSTLVVLTDSMEPEYKVGTAVFIKKVDLATLRAGDDITFWYNPWGVVVTHRLIDVQYDPTAPVGSQYTFTAHGINTDSDNCHDHDEEGRRDCTYQTQIFHEGDYIGKVTGSSKFVGFFYKLISSWYGLLIMLLIPCLYLIVTSVLDIFKAVKEDDGGSNVVDEQADNTVSNTNNALDELSEEDRERLKQELLDEMMGGSSNEK